ncbi:MAG: ribosome small subunit-dependent GTPase A [Oscillospiraceae bacterium]|nr:ribosome small subunit-dependent GTPase A [Oscillospiraceae bacterium]
MTDLKKTTGKIIKSVGGLFHVETNNGVIPCTAKGLFRLKEIAPCAGDNVVIETDNNCEPVITEVLPRKNHIIRPPLANIDAAVIVISTVEPSPNRLILDKLIAIFENKSIEPVLLFTKTDKKEEKDLIKIYQKAGFTVFSVSNESGEGLDSLRMYLQNGFDFNLTYALIGNTGVGKSSTLNSLFPELALETAEISKKLGRGKHTTRQAELFKCTNTKTTGGYIADTPGFSTVEAARYGKLDSAEAASCFREFIPYIDKCKFTGCRHVKEEGCAVISAKEEGIISGSRFESYIRIYENARAEERNYK